MTTQVKIEEEKLEKIKSYLENRGMPTGSKKEQIRYAVWQFCMLIDLMNKKDIYDIEHLTKQI